MDMTSVRQNANFDGRGSQVRWKPNGTTTNAFHLVEYRLCGGRLFRLFPHVERNTFLFRVSVFRVLALLQALEFLYWSRTQWTMAQQRTHPS